MQDLVRSVISRADEFVTTTGGIALGIFGLLFLFHVAEGAAELSQSPGSCRLFNGKFWLRMFLVAAVVGGYKPIVVGTAMAYQPTVMLSFTTKWAEVWADEYIAIDQLRSASNENKELNYADLSKSSAGKDDGGLASKAARFVVDGFVTIVGWIVMALAGLFITALILMEGFFALGVTTLLIGIGPICVAFAAHEKTEGLFWTFLKAFLVFGLLYMPVLALATEFAGVIMGRITHMASDSGAAFGDGSDIAVHFISVLVGPLCAFALVKSAPALLSSVVGAASLGAAGGAYDTARRSMPSPSLPSRKPDDDKDDQDKKKDDGGGSGGGSTGGGGGGDGSGSAQGAVAADIARAIRGE
jgi:uncharacterized membrane protein YgcG